MLNFSYHHHWSHSATIIIFTLDKLTQNLTPGPRPWPIIGNMLQKRPTKFCWLAKWSCAYGPIHSGLSLNIIVSSPQLAKEIQKGHDQKLVDRHRTVWMTRFSTNGNDFTWADYQTLNRSLWCSKRFVL